MTSMTLASLGWGTWWVLLFLHRFRPAWVPEGPGVPGLISTTFAIAGLLVALFTLRAQRSWLYFVMIPLMANASLLFVPLLASELFGPAAG